MIISHKHKDMQELTIGVDIGGTNAEFGIVTPEGDILCDSRIKTKDFPTPESFVDAGVECIHTMLADNRDKFTLANIKGMGVGAPNGNYHTGCIEYAPNLPWEGNVPLSQMFSEKLGIPVALTNDANAATIGEKIYGVTKEMNDFIMITLGTGVGSGIVANGNLIYGHDGMAGELGHMIMVRDENGRKCGCGRRGCLETYCSATGVAMTAREMLQNTNIQSELRNKSPKDIEALDVSVAASRGDKLALDVFQFTGEMLGKACADFATFSNPEAFIFFGGLARAGDLLMKHIEESFNKNAMPIFRHKAKFMISGLMNRNAGILGASAVVKAEF